MASKGERQLEILTAFSGRTKRSKSRSQKTPSLAWMHSQCSAKKKDAGEFQLFPHYSGDLSNVPPMEYQSYHYWKSVVEAERFAHPRRYRRRTILIQPLGHSQASSGYKHTEIHPSILSHLCHFCEQFFHGMTVEVAQQIDLSQIRKLTKRVHQSTNREQFLVGDIRRFLQSRRPNRAFCILGVTVADLYPSPEWNFVLGEASMAQGCGVFSFGRYFNSSAAVAMGGASSGCHGDGVQSGGDCEVEQLRNLWVLMRVMSHELCHIFGLKHCFYFDCAMNESNSIVEAATQPLFLCPICLRKMQKAVRFVPLERYKELLKIIKELHSAVVKASIDNDHKQSNIESETLRVSVEVNCADVVENKRTEGEPSPCGVNEQERDQERETCDSSFPGGKSQVEDNCACETVVKRKTNEDRTFLRANEEGIEREMEESKSNASEKRLVDEVSNSSHSEQFEGAILWLEKIVSSLGQFEDQWVEPKAGHRTKNKIV